MIERRLEKTSRILAISLAFGLGSSAVTACAEGINNTERTVTVCDKETVRVGSGDTESNESRVYTVDEDGRSHTYRVVDTVFIGGTRFNSADTFGRLNEGRTYEIESSGFRIGILGQFPNIIGVNPVDPDHPEWC